MAPLPWQFILCCVRVSQESLGPDACWCFKVKEKQGTEISGAPLGVPRYFCDSQGKMSSKRHESVLYFSACNIFWMSPSLCLLHQSCVSANSSLWGVLRFVSYSYHAHWKPALTTADRCCWHPGSSGVTPAKPSLAGSDDSVSMFTLLGCTGWVTAAPSAKVSSPGFRYFPVIMSCRSEWLRGMQELSLASGS